MKPTPRIAIGTPYCGGEGGIERYIYSMVNTCRDIDFDLFAGNNRGGELAHFPENTRLMSSLRWRPIGPRAPLNTQLTSSLQWLQRRASPNYSLFLSLGGLPQTVEKAIRAQVFGLIPAGRKFEQFPDAYDIAVFEAPGNDNLVVGAPSSYQLPPPVFPVAIAGELPEGLPKEYLLTVFNPYHRVKGWDVLMAAAEASRLPIVWCLSKRSLSNPEIDWKSIPPNIFCVFSPTQPELRAIYEKSLGYVSMSRREGFGWSMADALLYRKPILSRNTGVLTLPRSSDDGIQIYRSQIELQTHIAELSWLDRASQLPNSLLPATFRRRLARLISGRASIDSLPEETRALGLIP